VNRKDKPVWLLARLAWAVLLVAHAMWLAGAVAASTATLPSVLALLATVAFLGLKVADVGFLRVRTDRRALTSMAVVVLLLHAGPIQRSLIPESELTLWWLPLAATAGLCPALEPVRRIRRFAESLAALLALLQAVLFRAYRTAYAGFSNVLDHRLRHFSITLATPRAPPA